MHCGREGIVWELRIGKEKEKEKKNLLVCIVLAIL